MDGTTGVGFKLSSKGTLKGIRAMTFPRMYLLLIASVAGMHLLLRIGRPHEDLKGRETTCACCSEYAEKQESVNGWWEGIGGGRVVRNRGVGGELFAGDSGLSWMCKRVIHRLLALQISSVFVRQGVYFSRPYYQFM